MVLIGRVEAILMCMSRDYCIDIIIVDEFMEALVVVFCAMPIVRMLEWNMGNHQGMFRFSSFFGLQYFC
ncbi:Uncharacterised protein [Mycobacterium tuberculosis]|nr:Uncharacterised protein [Mycobacterium tuberculosis]